MTERLKKLINYINDKDYVVFWIAGALPTDHYHKLVEVMEYESCLIAYFPRKKGHVDLYNIDFDDIRIYKTCEIDL